MEQRNEWSSDRYRATLSGDGLLKVFNGKHELRKTMIDETGVIKVETTNIDNCLPEDRKMLAAMDRMPVFKACWGGGTDWWVDLDAGMSRFNGSKPRHQLKQALANCGFDEADITEILTQARKRCNRKPWESCPREW